MKFGSVCSGIEAASVAWEPLGWKAAWFAEIEPFPCALLAHHYPDVPNHGDMSLLPALVALGEVDAPDILCGGTPCQAFSVAGLRRSLDDARGNLSLIFTQLANAIDERRTSDGQQPSIVFWENVPGVLNTKDNAFGCFLAGLAGEDEALQPAGPRWTDCGVVFGPARTVAWRVLDAQYFGLAQRRKRVFVVASARDDFDPVAVLLEFDGVRRDLAPSREAGEATAGRAAAGAGVGGVGGPSVITMAHGQGGAEISFDRGPTLTCNHEAPILAHALRGEGFDASKDGTERGTPLVPVASHHNAQTCQLPSADRDTTVSDSLTCSQQAAVAFTQNSRSEVRHIGGDGQIVGALAAEAGAQQQQQQQSYIAVPAVFLHANKGRPDGRQSAHTEMVTVEKETVPTLTTDGHAQSAVAVDFRNMLEGDVAGTMQAKKTGYSYNAMPAVRAAMQVRRLTPRECERLQGFPDDYTLVPYRNKPAADGPRYKALGNSWAVPVVRWIGQRIDLALFV